MLKLLLAILSCVLLAILAICVALILLRPSPALAAAAPTLGVVTSGEACLATHQTPQSRETILRDTLRVCALEAAPSDFMRQEPGGCVLTVSRAASGDLTAVSIAIHGSWGAEVEGSLRFCQKPNE